jgi:hypothetical protein
VLRGADTDDRGAETEGRGAEEARGAEKDERGADADARGAENDDLGAEDDARGAEADARGADDARGEDLCAIAAAASTRATRKNRSVLEEDIDGGPWNEGRRQARRIPSRRVFRRLLAAMS